MNPVTISGTGCCLLDYLYSGIEFHSPGFSKYLSKTEGDGGLGPGRLVFTDEFELFSGKRSEDVLKELVGEHEPDAINLGGPSIVALIHAAQLLGDKAKVIFYGTLGNDLKGDKIIQIIHKIPINEVHIKRAEQDSPFTYVFSDPGFHNGYGERTFLNNIGAAWHMLPADLDEQFFLSDINVFGGTALVPNIHDNLHELLVKSKSHGNITIVNTVYDFRNEKANPGVKWPLGKTEDSLRYIDILVMDLEEALKISGYNNIETASTYFIENKVSSFVITDGASPVWYYSDGRLFKQKSLAQLPVSEDVLIELKFNTGISGDTTGCGDNLTGGIIASVGWQLAKLKPGYLDLIEACSWGIASGGFACFYMGGTYIENKKGEKYNLVKPLHELYLKQISNQY